MMVTHFPRFGHMRRPINTPVKKKLDQMKDSPIERVMEDRQELKLILK